MQVDRGLFGKPKCITTRQVIEFVLVRLFLAGHIGRKKQNQNSYEKTHACDSFSCGGDLRRRFFRNSVRGSRSSLPTFLRGLNAELHPQLTLIPFWN
jgi:hypothetical protein